MKFIVYGYTDESPVKEVPLRIRKTLKGAIAACDRLAMATCVEDDATNETVYRKKLDTNCEMW